MSSRQLQHEANHYNRLSITTTHKMTGKHQSKIMPFILISLSNTIHFLSERWNTKHPIFVRFAFVKWNERGKIISLVPIVALIIVFFYSCPKMSCIGIWAILTRGALLPLGVVHVHCFFFPLTHALACCRF